MALIDNALASGDPLPSDWCNEAASLASHLATIATGGAAGDTTLTAAEYRCRTLVATGGLTGNRNWIVPADAGRWWIVHNNTSGAFTLTVKTSGGTGIAVTQGTTMILRGDGTNIVTGAPAVAASLTALTQTYATADATHAALTSADLSGIASSTTGSALAEPGAGYTQSEMQQNFRRIQDQYNALKADLTDLKQFVNSLVDALQSAKIVG